MINKSLNRARSIELWLPLTVTVLVTIVVFFSNLDLKISGFFYNPQDKNWPLENNVFVTVVYNYGPQITGVLLLFALAVIILSYITPKFYVQRAKALFIIIAILLIPAFLVHVVMKETWKRPRPRSTIEFNGNHQFQKVLIVNDSNFKGRSFPSGHAAAGFILVAGYFLYKGKSRRKSLCWLGVGLIFGSVLSFVRIVMGGHFFSDTFWSFVLCWYGSYFLYYYWFLPYEAKLLSKPAFSLSKKRLLISGAFVFLILSAMAIFKGMIHPYNQEKKVYQTVVSVDVKKLKIFARVKKGNIHARFTDVQEIKVSTWAKGSGPTELQFERTFDFSEKVGLGELSITIKPTTWFWKYQSHTDIYVPRNLEVDWDIQSELGKIFWHE